MRASIKLLWILLIAVWVSPALGQGTRTIPSAEASRHVGEQATVCGYVASTRFLSTSRSKPTFLNLGKAYPNEELTVVIWPEDRDNFGEPESKYLHKNICITGEITVYRNSPQIVAKSPSQIKEH